MFQEEGKNVGNYPGFDGFKGLTTGSLDLLNARLEEVGHTKIKNLSELKSKTEEGLFTKTLKDAGKKGAGHLISANTQNAILRSAGVTAGLSFTGSGKYLLHEVLAEAVRRTKSLIEKELPVKIKAAPLKTTQNPIVETACGETFDPERCSLSKSASSPYRLEQVEAFMEAYHIYKPRGKNNSGVSDYKTMCDLLKEHWTRYMTAALVDVFGSGKKVNLSSRELREMATERGIKYDSKVTDVQLKKSLIRYMVDSILTIDATQYGLGKSSVSIVDTLMGGDLNIKNLEPKARLAVIMVGSRFNKKLLDFVTRSVDENILDTPEFQKEFNDFQQGLAHLRESVESLDSENTSKVTSGLIEAIAKTTKEESRKSAAAISQNTNPSKGTKGRVKQSILEFLENLQLSEFPNDTFKLFSELLRKSGIADILSESSEGYSVMAVTDAAMKELASKVLKTNLETFLSLKSVHNASRMMVVKRSKISEGTFKSLQETDLKFSKLDEKFRVVDLSTKFAITVSSEYGEHEGVRFYRVANMLLKKDMNLIEEEIAKLSEPEVQRKKTPEVQRKKTPEVQRKKTPEVQRKKTPEVQRKKTPEVQRKKTPEVQKSVSKEVEAVEVPLPDLVPKSSGPSLCQSILRNYKHKDVAKVSLLIQGTKSILGSVSTISTEALRKKIDQVVKAIDGSKNLQIKATHDIANFLIDLKEAFEKQRKVSSKYDPSIDMNDVSNSCQVLRDVISGKKEAVVPVSKAVSPPRKKSVKEESEEEEPVELQSLDEIIEVSGASIFNDLVGYYDAEGDLIINNPEPITIFAPSNEAFEEFFDSYNLKDEELEQETELLDAIVTAHYSIGEDGALMEDGETEWTPQGQKYVTDGIELYVVNEVKVNSQAEKLLEEFSQRGKSVVVADIKSNKVKGTSEKTVRSEIEPQMATLEGNSEEEEYIDIE